MRSSPYVCFPIEKCGKQRINGACKPKEMSCHRSTYPKEEKKIVVVCETTGNE